MASVVYKDEHIEILCDSGLCYIRSIKPGLSLDMFRQIHGSRLPNVRITNPQAVIQAIEHAPAGPELFGEEQARVNIRISEDSMKACLTLRIEEGNMAPQLHSSLQNEIRDALHKAGIVFGIKTELLNGPLESKTEYTIAEGLPVKNGEDSKIKLYEVAPPKPEIIESGSVNYYELNLINQVKQGDWLGERRDATLGLPGRDVLGREIPPVPGEQIPLAYDHISVREEYTDGMTTLYSKKDGAVYYKGDTIGVYDFLEIKGDIDFSTGNIDFNGFLSVKGTVKDNFAALADKDVEILSEYGVGAADKIISREGNIYIKGGISGKGKTLIRCKKNLYVKYLSDIDVECEGSVLVGFYCMNSNIRAKQVIVESPKGRIIGGQIYADICVSAAEIGSRSEARTLIRVKGFDRAGIQSELQKISALLKEKKDAMTRMRNELQSFSSPHGDLKKGRDDLRGRMADLMHTIKELEYQYKNLSDFLKTPGEGAVMAKKRLYPRVKIDIKGIGEEIFYESGMITYAYSGNELTIL